MAAFIEDDVAAAIAHVRDDRAEQDWVLLGYASKESVKLIGTGTGGIEELKGHLIEGDVCYGLVRKSHTWETAGNVSAETVKFVWVYWRPENIPIMRKMKIGIFEGQMKKLFQPYHVEMQPSTLEEVGGAQLNELLDSVTMRADKTGNKAATGAALGARSTVAQVDRRQAKGFLPTGTGADTANKAVKGAEVSFKDPEALSGLIGAVRSDTDPTDWCLVGYADPKSLEVVGQGAGGLEELLATAQDSTVNYGLFRVTDRYDKTDNVRFCFITWQPEDLPPTFKARVSTHKGTVAAAFREHCPYQYEFRTSTREELTVANVLEHIGQYTGSRSKVLDAPRTPPSAAGLEDGGAATAGGSGGGGVAQVGGGGGLNASGGQDAVFGGPKREDSKRTFLGGVTGATEKVAFADEGALRAAIARVRSDKDEADFCCALFEGGSKLALKEVGIGGLEGLKACLAEDAFAYGLVRLNETIDASITVKFCYVKWAPEGVPASVKGRLGVLQGAVTGVFSPFHGDLVAASPEDLTEEAVISSVSNLRAKNRAGS